MKKAMLIVIIIITSSLSGCYLFGKVKYTPEKIIPEILMSGDIDQVRILHIEEMDKKVFGGNEGYAISDFLSKIILLSTEYDVMVMSRDGKAIRIEGSTLSQCYLIEKEGKILELHSEVHHYFENGFLPLSGVSEIAVLSKSEVNKGIMLNGGSTERISVNSQLDLLYKPLRTYESNDEYKLREYARETVSAEKLLGNAQSANLALLGGSIINISADTSEILDWRMGHLVLRSNNLAILSVTLISE